MTTKKNPVSLVVIPTRKCDLRCHHCLRDNFGGENMPIEMFDRFSRELLSHNPNLTFAFTGGEPTIHPQFDRMLELITEYGRKFTIVTNGINVKGRNAIIKHKDIAYSVMVSLDSPIEEINDIVRGEGSFKKAIETICAYSENKVPVIMKFVAHDDNIDSMIHCFELAERCNVRDIAISSLHTSVKVASSEGRTKSLAKGKDLSTGDKVAQKILEIEQEHANNYPHLRLFLTKRHFEQTPKREWREEACSNYKNIEHYPERDIVLLPDGKISMCCDLYDLDYDHTKYVSCGDNKPLDHILGDVNHDSLQQILQRKIHIAEELTERRREDYDKGMLTNGREHVCANCKFYHYQNSQRKTIWMTPS